MQNERSTKRGASRQHTKSGDVVLSGIESVASERGQLLKRYVRAAAALQGVFDDTELADKVQRGRLTVGKWWTGARPEPEALEALARETGLSIEELTRFVYFDGPPPTLPEPRGLDPETQAAARELDLKARTSRDLDSHPEDDTAR